MSRNLLNSYFWSHLRVCTFQQTDRRPDTHGFPSLSVLTAFLSASKLLACLIVSCHRFLVDVSANRTSKLMTTYLDSSKDLITQSQIVTLGSLKGQMRLISSSIQLVPWFLGFSASCPRTNQKIAPQPRRSDLS